MRNYLLHGINAFIETALEYCPDEKRPLLMAAATQLLKTATPTPKEQTVAHKPGRPLQPYSIITYCGVVHVTGLNAAAALLGVKPATLQSKLSAAKGKLAIMRPHPETWNPEPFTVTRGHIGDHNDNALEMLQKISVAKGGKVRHKNVTEAATSPGLPSKHVNKLRSDK